MAGTSTSCLYSTVKNVSGATMTFSFLPPHGVELEADEEYNVVGDIAAAISRNRGATGGRYIDSLLAALSGSTNDGDPTLALIKTPNPILYDETAEESKMLVLDDEELGTAVACTDSSI